MVGRSPTGGAGTDVVVVETALVVGTDEEAGVVTEVVVEAVETGSACWEASPHALVNKTKADATKYHFTSLAWQGLLSEIGNLDRVF
jgi:hypothetical protein